MDAYSRPKDGFAGQGMRVLFIYSLPQGGAGVAHTLMQKAISISVKKWPEHNIQLGGQEHLTGFYQQQGFEPVSDVYLEDGIPHLDMLLTLKGKK